MSTVYISPHRIEAFFDAEDRRDLATRIRDITYENPTPENLDQLKQQIYELTSTIDRDMSQKAFLVACFYKLKHPQFEAEMSANLEKGFSYLSDLGKMPNMEPLLLEDAKQIELKEAKKFFIQMLKKVHQSDITEEKLLHYINLFASEDIREFLDFLNSPITVQGLIDLKMAVQKETKTLIKETRLDKMSTSDSEDESSDIGNPVYVLPFHPANPIDQPDSSSSSEDEISSDEDHWTDVLLPRGQPQNNFNRLGLAAGCLVVASFAYDYFILQGA